MLFIGQFVMTQSLLFYTFMFARLALQSLLNLYGK